MALVITAPAEPLRLADVNRCFWPVALIQLDDVATDGCPPWDEDATTLNSIDPVILMQMPVLPNGR